MCSFGNRGSTPIYEGQLEFKQSVTIARDKAAGPAEIVCNLSYQACNDSLCQPPKQLRLTAALNIKR